MRPLRASATIDAPEGAVRRAVLRADIWTRTVRAIDAHAEIAGERPLTGSGDPRAPLKSGDLVRIRRRSTRQRFETMVPRRSLILRVTVGSGDQLLLFDVLAGPVQELRVSLTLAEAGSQTVVTVDTWFQAEPALLTPLFRRRIRRAEEILLGILTLAARELLVVVAGAVIDNARVLAARRSSPPALAGKWELPGGKVEPGETDAGALAREIAEELGLTVVVGGRIGDDVDLGGNTVLRCYRVGGPGRPQPTEHDEIRWLGAADLYSVDWLGSDRQILPALFQLLTD